MASNGKLKQYTLAFDVGGSHVKGALLGRRGDLVTDKLKAETPNPLTPVSLVRMLAGMAGDVPHFDRVAVGIPGIVHRNVVWSLPASGSSAFKGFPLADRLANKLGVPCRVTNDAAMHGLSAISGKGVEMVITLGTGLGTALFIDRVLSAHYQTLPDDDEPFGSPYGDAARKQIGRRRWVRRVERLVDQLREITNFDRLYIGGGNAKKLPDALPHGVMRIDNIAGILGGHRLWEWGEVP